MSGIKDLVDNTAYAQHSGITASEFQNMLNKMRERGAFKNGKGFFEIGKEEADEYAAAGCPVTEEYGRTVFDGNWIYRYLDKKAIQPQDKTLDGK